MNSLLHAITEQGLNHTLYNIFFAAGFAAVLFFNLLNAKNFRIPRLRAVILTVLVYVVSTFWMMVLCWIENGFRNFGANNIVRVCVEGETNIPETPKFQFNIDFKMPGTTQIPGVPSGLMPMLSPETPKGTESSAVPEKIDLESDPE